MSKGDAFDFAAKILQTGEGPDHEECSTCPLNARIAEAKAFLAKFEKEPE